MILCIILISLIFNKDNYLFNNLIFTIDDGKNKADCLLYFSIKDTGIKDFNISNIKIKINKNNFKNIKCNKVVNDYNIYNCNLVIKEMSQYYNQYISFGYRNKIYKYLKLKNYYFINRNNNIILLGSNGALDKNSNYDIINDLNRIKNEIFFVIVFDNINNVDSLDSFKSEINTFFTKYDLISYKGISFILSNINNIQYNNILASRYTMPNNIVIEDLRNSFYYAVIKSTLFLFCNFNLILANQHLKIILYNKILYFLKNNYSNYNFRAVITTTPFFCNNIIYDIQCYNNIFYLKSFFDLFIKYRFDVIIGSGSTNYEKSRFIDKNFNPSNYSSHHNIKQILIYSNTKLTQKQETKLPHTDTIISEITGYIDIILHNHTMIIKLIQTKASVFKILNEEIIFLKHSKVNLYILFLIIAIILLVVISLIYYFKYKIKSLDNSTTVRKDYLSSSIYKKYN